MVATDLKMLHQHLRDQLRVANEAYSCFADKKREDMPDWKVGTKVWLDLHNVKTKRPMKKLDSKHAGPFQILAKISTHMYRLQLPVSMRGIHDVFHVSLLEKTHEDTFPQRRQPPPPPIEIDGEQVYEVADILDSRRRGRKVHYLVRWEGYGPEDDTWEPLEALSGAKELLEDFHSTYPHKPRAT